MKLNKSQRHTAYIILAAEVEDMLPAIRKCRACIRPYMGYGYYCRNYTVGGLCDLFDTILEDYAEAMSSLPELRKRKPSNLYTWDLNWFPNSYKGWLKRLELLNQCIEETY